MMHHSKLVIIIIWTRREARHSSKCLIKTVNISHLTRRHLREVQRVKCLREIERIKVLLIKWPEITHRVVKLIRRIWVKTREIPIIKKECFSRLIRGKIWINHSDSQIDKEIEQWIPVEAHNTQTKCLAKTTINIKAILNNQMQTISQTKCPSKTSKWLKTQTKGKTSTISTMTPQISNLLHRHRRMTSINIKILPVKTNSPRAPSNREVSINKPEIISDLLHISHSSRMIESWGRNTLHTRMMSRNGPRIKRTRRARRARRMKWTRGRQNSSSSRMSS